MGDLDGNGAVDFAVGIGEYDIDYSFGSVLVVFLNPDHTVLKETRIGNADDGESPIGGLENMLPEDAYFGTAVVGCLGDLDGDGVPDMIVGADGDDDSTGALYVMFMLATGMVKKQQKIGYADGGLNSFISLRKDDWWGTTVGGVVVTGEDMDASGTVGVLVGTAENDDVYHLRLKGDGKVASAKLLKIVSGRDGDGGMAGVGDVDGNGVVDFAIGAPYQHRDRGAVYILLMEEEGGEILKETFIRSETAGMIRLQKYVFFGFSVAALGDLDGDGIRDISAGAPDTHPWDADEWGAGAVYILLLKRDGSVKGVNVISAEQGGMIPPVKAGDNFGSAIATLVERGDSEQGVVTLVVGAWNDGTSAPGGGAVYVLTVPPVFVERCPAENENCIRTGDTSYECG